MVNNKTEQNIKLNNMNCFFIGTMIMTKIRLLFERLLVKNVLRILKTLLKLVFKLYNCEIWEIRLEFMLKSFLCTWNKPLFNELWDDFASILCAKWGAAPFWQMMHTEGSVIM